MAAGPTPALDRLLGRHRERFATEGWGHSAVLASRLDRPDGDEFADLFGPDTVDDLIAHRGLRTPFLRVVLAGATVEESRFTSGAGVGAGVGDQVSDDLVRRLFADGATLVLQGLHRTWPPLLAFSQQLAAELGHPVQVNAYVTPAQNQGFSDHYDVHDVFVLQVHGRKRWLVHAPVLDSPLRSQTTDTRAAEVERAAQAPALVDATLSPGDCLYLPRGFIHAARALGETSIHLTIGVHPWTRHHLARALLDAADVALREDRDMRSSLPLGTASPLDAVEAVRTAVLDAVAKVDAAALASSLLAQHRAAQRPAPLAPLAQLAAADVLTPDSTLRLRDGLLASLEDAGVGEVAVRSRAGRCTLPDETRPALERLLADECLPVWALAADAAEAVRRGRTLLVEGVALVHPG